MQFNLFSSVLLCLVFIISVLPCLILADQITEKERVALEQLRPRVENVLPHDYMKEDTYLVKFLRAKSLDVGGATDLMQNMVQWRKEKNMDNILNEDFSKVYKDSPFWMEGVDKTGSPIVIVNNGRWDIRKYAVSGNRETLTRYWDYMMEKIAVKVREIANTTEGKDVTQAVMIMDIEGYNLRQQGCFSCLSIFLEWMSHTETYYPENFKSLNMVNTPRIFSPLLEILKPAMSPSTRKILQAHGPNKKEWSQVLLKTIDADQLPRLYGGTKAR